MQRGHGICVVSFYQRDHRRRGFALAQRFYDREALHTRPDVHDREINILQREAEDLERVLFLIVLYLAVSPCAGEIISAPGYQQNIPLHNRTYVSAG